MLLNNSVMGRILLILILALTILGVHPTRTVHAQGQGPTSLDLFDLLNETSGWILIEQHLFWTSDAGDSWEEIGPQFPSAARVQDVEFLDADVGWMLLSEVASDGSTSFQLARTTDHGRTWNSDPLVLFDPGEVASYAERAQMGWFDEYTGWISIKQATGSNFSVGTLFVTTDGGGTWQRSALPLADDVDFRVPQHGWAVGGPTGDQLFQTRDAGSTWQAIPLQEISDVWMTAYMPFSSDEHGLFVTTVLGRENTLQVHVLDHSADEWRLHQRVSLAAETEAIGLSILDSQNFVATIPGTNVIVRMRAGELELLENQDGRSASIVELDMVSTENGWGRSVVSDCVRPSSARDRSASLSCSSTTRLLRTADGGLTWQDVRLPVQTEPTRPGILSREHSIQVETMPGVGNSQILIGQAFDKCEIPTLSQLSTWAASSPYQAVNLYIGGANRACQNSALTASFVRQARQRGWQFIPTWVGPQAPCTGYPSRMSSDPAVAFEQGVAEANLAVERLAQLGLTYPDKTGSVVYYDIEPYGTNVECRNAVNSFMNGWVSQLEARENLAGVYGSTLCDTALSDFRNITNPPHVIWPARWFHNLGEGYYDPNATVWNLGSCIPNSAWANHQRIRQYEGDHNEVWGNLTLNIDSNVVDGVVAIPYGFFIDSIRRADENPTNAPSVDFVVSFLRPVTGVDVEDFKLSTTGVPGAAITNVSGTGDTYIVTVSTGSGNGTIRLDIVDDDSIQDTSGHPLGGPGTGNGNYSNGETYTIQTTIFDDTPLSHWALDYIERLYATGITGGCSVTPRNYCPELTVTRAEMAVFLERGIHGSDYTPPSVGEDTGFTDVSASYWAAAWIKQLAADRITSGCASGMYCPESPVTRAEMAIFLLKAKNGASYTPPAAGESTGFADVPAGYWAADWVKQLVVEGITAGCGNSNYCPDSPVTRAEMAVFLVRTFNLP